MQLTRSFRLLAALALVALASCGGSADPQAATAAGAKALAANDYPTAAREYGAAVAAIGTDTSHPQFASATKGLAKAMAGIDPAKCKSQTLTLLTEHRDLVDDKLVYDVANRLGENGHFGEAIDLIEKGKELFADSKSLDTLGNELAKKLASSGSDPAELERLKGLGYLGD